MLTQTLPPTNSPDEVKSVELNLPSFRLLRFNVQLRFNRATDIPDDFLGNILRGGIGLSLRQLVCPKQWMDNECPPCPLYQNCVYGQVFRPSPPVDSFELRKQTDTPRPFVIVPSKSKDLPSRELEFQVMLFGTAVHSLAYWVTALQRLGHSGLGRDRIGYGVIQVRALHPQGDEVLFSQGGQEIRYPSHALTNSQLRENCRKPPDHAPIDARVRFLTPLLLREGSGVRGQDRIRARQVIESPTMGVLIRRARDRFSSLSTFFGEKWQTDFRLLGELSDSVQTLTAETEWIQRSRRSTRTGQSHELSGLVGYADYRFPSASVWQTLEPLLRLGEWIHIGKNTPWGNGFIQVQPLWENAS
jgi:hypothetical protein